MLNALLRFETTVPQRPKLDQISNAWPPVKVRGGVGEISESKRSPIKVDQGGSQVLDFGHVAPFRSQKVSKATGVGNRAKISHFLAL